MIALSDILNYATTTLKAAASVDVPRLEARILVAHVLGVAPDGLLNGQLWIPPEGARHLDELLARRSSGEPIAYITGKKEFFGLEFAVGPGALVPRPESETLIEEALREFPQEGAPLAVLDLGTGTGCLLATFLMLRPKARGVGIDFSANALKWAELNILRHDLAERCELRQADWNRGVRDEYDVIFANPPYISSFDLERLPVEVRAFEPPSALDSGPDGLDAYRQLGPILSSLLCKKGVAFLEIGQGQHHVVGEILGRSGLEIARVAMDLAEISRGLVVRSKA